MSLEDLEKESIGKTLTRLIWGMGELMRRRVANYRVSGDLQELKEAVTLPVDRRDKILNYISQYETSYIDECFVAAGGKTTRQELNAISLSMATDAIDRFNRYQGGESADSIATDIEENVTGSRHPGGFSPGYLNLWGE